MSKNALYGMILSLFVALAGSACGPREEAPSETPPPSSGNETEAPADETASGDGSGIVVGTDACTTDADCVPAACCHATACVARANAPTCNDVMCTMDCRGGTTDCGGGCLCQEGRCAARLMVLPDPQVAPQ